MYCYCFGRPEILHVASCLTGDDQYYLEYLYGNLSANKIIVTSYLKYLYDLVDGQEHVYVHGPKGVGKTYSLLFLACHDDLANAFVLLAHELNNDHILTRLEMLERKHCKFIMFA